jgi:hypothetical protein
LTQHFKKGTPVKPAGGRASLEDRGDESVGDLLRKDFGGPTELEEALKRELTILTKVVEERVCCLEYLVCRRLLLRAPLSASLRGPAVLSML